MQKWDVIRRGHNIVHGFQRLQLYSTSTSASTTSSTRDTLANYLVDSLGFSHKQALSTYDKLTRWNRKVKESTIETNADSVVNFFKNHGFDDTHIRKIVSFEPRLLKSNVDRTLEPKFKLLKDGGFSGSDITTVFTRHPRILFCGFESCILPAIQTLKQVLGCDYHAIKAFKKIGERSYKKVVENLSPNIALLGSYGIPIELIRKHMVQQPTFFLGSPEAFKGMLVRIEHKLGIPRTSPMFLYGLSVATRTEENIDSKCQVLKSFGWTESDIETFMMKIPTCFAFSEASFKKKLDFLMKELLLKPAHVTSCIPLFTCSLEKRIVPRHKVLLVLKEKGLLKEKFSMCKAVSFSEASFLEKFVLPFKEVHEVYAKHTGCSVRMLTEKQADNL